MLDEDLEPMLFCSSDCSIESSFSKKKTSTTKTHYSVWGFLQGQKDSYSLQVSCEHISTTILFPFFII